jgi:hypothetical protein
MTEYRRAWLSEATWSFTVNLVERRGNRCPSEQIVKYVTEYLCEKSLNRRRCISYSSRWRA